MKIKKGNKLLTRNKGLLRRSIIMVILFFVLSASCCFADITGSKHDFSVGSGRIEIAGAKEICVFCHTPHHATQEEVPLWNHEITSATFTTYSSDTLNASVGQPIGISKLCLSCHDGTVAVDSYGGSTGYLKVNSAITKIGTDLSNNHPVSFTYDSDLAVSDGALLDPEEPGVATLLFNSRVECASCHDVHNNTDIPFNFKLLRMSNEGSALCFQCHLK